LAAGGGRSRAKIGAKSNLVRMVGLLLLRRAELNE
jgi:hypothetical protein